MHVKNTFTPVEKKTVATANKSTREIIKVNKNPKNAVDLKLVLIYKNQRITAPNEDDFYTIQEILPHNMNASSWAI